MKRKGDAGLAGIFLLAVAVEVALRPDLQQRPWPALLGVVCAGSLWFRQSQPLAATVFAFGFAAATTLVEMALDTPDLGPFSGACILLLPYSLCRLGSRRHIAVGGAFMLLAYAASVLHQEMDGIGDAIGAAVVMLFPGVVGLSVRYRAAAQLRDIDHAKLKEREQLARELHDSVAHHMTAITIAAQAARAVLRARPEDAERTLLAIELESRRGLAELRDIVGALREDDEAALSPVGGIADIAGFARDGGTPPAVTVEFSGDLNGLAASVQRALYRLAQESITNALKHAKNATCIAIRVAAEGDAVHLTARDDGMPAGAPHQAGFGLIGMAERAALLGGTFAAGASSGGWCVNAVLPRAGGAA